MREFEGQIRLSASDVAKHLGCRHLTGLDHRTALRQLEPPSWRNSALEVLQERGYEHEAAYLDQLRNNGREVTVVEATESLSAFEATVAAMREGSDVIVQASLDHGRWHGRADVLLRVDRGSDLGAWSYEVLDTKLSRETKAGTILQLCLYTDIVGRIQGFIPEQMHVVSPGRGFVPESFRVLDYLAYYRHVQKSLEAAVDGREFDGTYPEPVPQCDVCRWWKHCDDKRRADDHLSLVAGLTKLQARELQSRGINSLTELASLSLPIGWRPSRGSGASYEQIHHQARLQLQGRTDGPTFELLAAEAGRGLSRLPAPSPGDIFFDLEGDPFFSDSGIEYLFGYVVVGADGQSTYSGHWAFTAAQEKEIFEGFVDFVLARLEEFPDLHVYHYAPYEPSALKRLMGRYGTREDDVDRLLRAGVLVDLYAVARQGVRASIERYSIKNFEVFYGFERDVDLRIASDNLRALERAIELNCVADVDAAVLEAVEGYNRDDCVSTLHLRDWLEQLRSQQIADGCPIARPVVRDGEPGQDLSDKRQDVLALTETIAGDIPTNPDDRSAEQQGAWLAAQFLDWHRREAKGPWFEYFRLCDLPVEDLLNERGAVANLHFLEETGGTEKCPVHRYRYEPQETDLRVGDELHATSSEKIGRVAAIDLTAETLDIKCPVPSTGPSDEGLCPELAPRVSVSDTGQVL